MSFMACPSETGSMGGILHVKMGAIKDRNGIDLKEAEDIKQR